MKKQLRHIARPWNTNPPGKLADDLQIMNQLDKQSASLTNIAHH